MAIPVVRANPRAFILVLIMSMILISQLEVIQMRCRPETGVRSFGSSLPFWEVADLGRRWP